MNINIYSQKIANFLSLRLIELTGILFILISSFFLLALISYSPEDPNFIISDRQEIKNLMGFRGSYAADILFQSLGLIVYLIPLNFCRFLRGTPLKILTRVYSA